MEKEQKEKKTEKKETHKTNKIRILPAKSFDFLIFLILDFEIFEF